MAISIVSTNIVVLPKNTVIKEKNLNNLFYNIRTKKLEYGLGYKSECSWFEKLDDELYIINDDTMYIKFLNDVSHPVKGYCSAMEMISDEFEYEHSEIRKDYKEVWEIVKDDYQKFLDDKKYIKLSLPYLIGINIHSTYCSYAGDGDVYINISKVIKIQGDKFKETEIIKDERFYV